MSRFTRWHTRGFRLSVAPLAVAACLSLSAVAIAAPTARDKAAARTFAADGRKAHIERRLSFAKPLTDEQSLRLLEIAGKTPVTLALTSGITIDTSIQHTTAA